jgi:hypothetical protein
VSTWAKFQKDVENLQKELKDYQKKLKEGLETDLSKSKESLITALVPSIFSNPPRALIYKILDDKPTPEDCHQFLQEELDRVFPSAETLIADMALRCRYKAVTFDTLIDPKFRERAKEMYPELRELFQEYDAAKARDPASPAQA